MIGRVGVYKFLSVKKPLMAKRPPVLLKLFSISYSIGYILRHEITFILSVALIVSDIISKNTPSFGER